MVESAEGIGSRKWSLLKDADGRFVVMQGPKRIAIVEDASLMHLLVTVPQLWEAANEVCKRCAHLGASQLENAGLSTEVVERIANAVAKSVNKLKFDDVLQA